MKIGMIGAGYVGLVTAACLSDFGHKVICFDNNEKKISGLNDGDVPIFEPGLDLLIKKNVAADRLYFNSNMKDCIDSLDVLFVAVDTPTRRADGQADLNSLFSAIKEIANISKDKKLLR